MNSMESLEISLDRIAIAEVISSIAYIPGNDTRIPVDITHIDHPHNFYVRPTKFRSVIPAVQRYGDRLDDSELHIGKTVIYKSRIMSECIRGRIINIVSTDDCALYDLHTPDYGFIETKIKTRRMRKPILQGIQPLAQRCFLAECGPRGKNFPDEVVNSMRLFLGNKTADIIVKANTQEYLIVKVITFNSDDLARLMAFTNCSVFGYNNAINRHSVPRLEPEQRSLTYKPLKAGDVLHVRIQSGNSFQGFFVAQMDDYDEYLKLRSDITYFSKQKGKLDNKNVLVGQPVAVPHAMCNNLFERAIIKAILSPEKVIVQLIDWGKKMEVHSSSLYTLTDKFFHIPAIAIYCSIEENKVFNNRRIKLLPGCNFKIKIDQVGDNFNTPNSVSLVS